MGKMIPRAITCLLILTVSTLSHAGGSQDGFDTLAYLQFRVGESMAPRCTERFPEYETQFKHTLATFSSTYHKRIERGRSLALRAAEQGKGNLDADIERRANESKQTFPQMSDADVQGRCESILEELQIKE